MHPALGFLGALTAASLSFAPKYTLYYIRRFRKKNCDTDVIMILQTAWFYEYPFLYKFDSIVAWFFFIISGSESDKFF